VFWGGPDYPCEPGSCPRKQMRTHRFSQRSSYSAWPSAGSTPPAANAPILMFNEQGAEAYGLSRRQFPADPRHWQLRPAGAGRPSTAASRLWKGRFCQQTSPLRRQTLLPKRIARDWVGLRPFRADGCTDCKVERSATRRLIHHVWATAALGVTLSWGDGPGRRWIWSWQTARPGAVPCSVRGG